MKYFDRVCTVDISPDIKVSELRVKFEVRKNIESNKNFANVSIYNLSNDSRNRISSDALNLLILKAGYLNNVGLVTICKGNITDVIHEFKTPEIITNLYCKDGFKSIKNKNITLSFSENTRLSRVIEVITSKLGLPVKFANYDKSAFFKTGYACVGSISEVLDDLSKQFDFDWSIQNGEVQILNKNTSTSIQSVFLSTATGLIETPTRLVRLADDTTTRYQITALLQPNLEVGDLISVESKTLNGVFKVQQLTHSGDTHGADWITKIIVTTRNG
jgi:hypothetical protein